MTDERATNLTLLRAAVPVTHRLIAGITPQQWRSSTPCEGMDVAGLVAHLVGGLEQFAAVPTSDPAATAHEITEPSLDSDQAAPAYGGASVRMLAAWSREGVLAASYDMPWGATPGSALVGFMVIEQVVHGWDLARATGQSPEFGDDLAQATLEMARSYDDASIRVPGMFGPIVEIAPAAPAIDRLAAFLGRHP